jgi:hypothetical protein
MTKKRRAFKRRVGKYNYRKVFVISTEGSKTEPQYFGMFNNQDTVIQIKCLYRDTDSSPQEILKRINHYLKREDLRRNYEAWLVVDKDNWSESQLTQLSDWAKSNESYGFALSNPRFEYWLLLHFEDGHTISSATLNRRLKKYLPDFDKGNVEIKKLEPGIQAAILRAKQKDFPPCQDWPRKTGTTVYRLVEKLVK